MAVTVGFAVVLKVFCLLSFLLYSPAEAAIQSEWSWESGSNLADQPSINSANVNETCPGGRKGSTGWLDGRGDLWLYGGSGKGFKKQEEASTIPYILLDDLWRFDVASRTWSFSRPDEAVHPSPLSRAGSCNSSMDTAIIFGGSKSHTVVSNQTWILDLSSHTWTLLESALSPQGRDSFAVWCTAREMWVFGGYGGDESKEFQDMWKFSLDNHTWEKQDLKGELPSARRDAITWFVPSKGMLFLFGGQSGRNFLSDMWVFSLTGKKWIPVHDGGFNAPGVYGTCNASSHHSFPGSRSGSAAWTDFNGNLWLFGGSAYSESENESGYLSDLWMFETQQSCWSWMGGEKLLEQGPHYPTRHGERNVTNLPGPRSHAVSWTAGGDLWLFGGVGHDSSMTDGHLNDLWRLDLELPLREAVTPEHPLRGNSVDLSMSTRIAISCTVLFFALAFTMLVCYNRGSPRKRLKEKNTGTKIRYERVTDSVESIDINTAA